MKAVDDYIVKGIESSSYHMSEVSYDSVNEALKRLKHEKADGDRGFISSHLIYASKEYHRQVAHLFTCMISHGHHPDPLVVATIISIPKDYREDLSRDDNYRGIALSNSLTKLLDLILLERNREQLTTSPLQFAFKKHTSTSMCTLVMKEVIRHYMENKSDVYSCCMDASKAFDRLKHDKLFSLLIERQTNILDLRILYRQYRCQKIRTTWHGKNSDYFNATNGIRQGSIASPILFCVYLDKLLNRLHQEGIGCWMGNMFYGTLAYADDVTLLCPTASGLQSMIDICENFGNQFGMKYNEKKTVCILYSRKCRPVAPLMQLSASTLKWVNCVKHLGNYVSNNLKETQEINNKRGDIIGRVNVIVGSLTGVNTSSQLKVLRSQCHFHGSEAWHLRDYSVKTFYSTVNRAIRRIMHLPFATHTRFLQPLSGLPLSKDSIANRFVKMHHKMLVSENPHISFIARRGQSCAHTIIGTNLSLLSRQYDIPVPNLLNVRLQSNALTESDNSTVQAVKDTIQGLLPDFFTSEEIGELLTKLCQD